MFKKYLLTGLLIWVPVMVTLWVLNAVVGVMDQTLLLLPEPVRPENLFGFKIPGLGIVLTLLILVVTGLFAGNIVGDTLLQWANGLLTRIPFFNTIYSSIKQVSDTLLSAKGQAFREAVLVKFHHDNTWSLGFVTGDAPESMAPHLDGPSLAVYVPTALSPTSGYVVLVSEKNIRPSGMSVDEAIKFIVSMGVVSPGSDDPETPY